MAWVVPSIAAELWDVSLEHVMSEIRAGALAWREEFGFLWVEVMGQSVVRPDRADWQGPTYTSRTEAAVVHDAAPGDAGDAAPATDPEAPNDSVAPNDPDAQNDAEAPNGKRQGESIERVDHSFGAIAWAAMDTAWPVLDFVPVLLEPEAVDPPEPDECESPEDPDDGVPMNWREARSRAAATRRRPPMGAPVSSPMSSSFPSPGTPGEG